MTAATSDTPQAARRPEAPGIGTRQVDATVSKTRDAAGADHNALVCPVPGDTAIFVSKIIPGNGRIITYPHNRLISAGAGPITEKDLCVHVPGHPMQNGLAQLRRRSRPDVPVPVYGEPRCPAAHAVLGRPDGTRRVPIVANIDLPHLAPRPGARYRRITS